MATTGTIYIRSQGRDFGPYSEAELKSHVKAGRIPFAAWIYKGGDWSLLAEDLDLRQAHPDFEARPKGEPQAEKASAACPLGIPPRKGSPFPKYDLVIMTRIKTRIKAMRAISSFVCFVIEIPA